MGERHYVDVYQGHGLVTFTATPAPPACQHPNRFKVSRRWWIVTWTAWICPECRDLVPSPAEGPVEPKAEPEQEQVTNSDSQLPQPKENQ